MFVIFIYLETFHTIVCVEWVYFKGVFISNFLKSWIFETPWLALSQSYWVKPLKFSYSTRNYAEYVPSFLYFIECQLQKHNLIEQLKRELAEAKKAIGEGSKAAPTVNGDVVSNKEHVSKVRYSTYSKSAS